MLEPSAQETYSLHQGELPILVSLPHIGTGLPDGFAKRLSPAASILPDTDWFVDKLYDRVLTSEVSIIKPFFSRYLADLNRPGDNHSLYPGQNTTGLCPLTTFHGDPIYVKNEEPDKTELTKRRQFFWQPYHDALQNELERLRAIYGHVLLWDAHSINPVIPNLFEGRLPDLNIGTNQGNACAPAIQRAVEEQTKTAKGFTWVSNGRFTGGYITRHFGDPDNGIHAVQLEMATSAYMRSDPPYIWDAQTAAPMATIVEDIFNAAKAALLSLNK